MEKRLYRSRSERVLWGVCGGLAKYFDMDPVIVRIIFVLLVFANGLGILAYIIMAILVPLEGSRAAASRDTIRENVQEIKQSATELGEEIRSGFARQDKPGGVEPDAPPKAVREHRSRRILGIVLICVGIFLLVSTFNLFWWFRWAYLWPAILIVAGIIIVFAARRK